MSTLKSSAEDLILNADGASSEVKIQQNGTTAITIDSSERVGVGATSLNRKLTILTTDQTDVAITAANNQYAQLCFGDPEDDNIGVLGYNNSDNSMSFTTNTTEQLKITSDGRGLSQFTAKAWCKADMGGSSGHTPTITNSHNISSFTDHGVGNVELSFTNSIAANATAVWAVDLTQNLGDVVTVTNYYSSPGTTSCRARVFDHSANLSDSDALHVQVFGD